jgi:glutamate synthase (NADPH/NADH) large chain
VEAGDVREVHHVALLIGYGAAAVNPYLAMETAEDLALEGLFLDGVEPADAVRNLVRALGKGVLKVMSKMGVSTVASYTGAQIFEALGLSQDLVERYFTGDLEQARRGGTRRHRRGGPPPPPRGLPDPGIGTEHRHLDVGGEYQWRRGGEPHLFDPDTVFRLQHSTRAGRYDIFKQYTKAVDDQSSRLMTLRGLFAFSADRQPIPIEEVEPVSEIVKRFSDRRDVVRIHQPRGARDARHRNEPARRQVQHRGGRRGRRPAARPQPAQRDQAGRVRPLRRHSEYLTHADDIQIKMAQGAKPGEGGQLPGAKVYPWVATTRHSTPGSG